MIPRQEYRRIGVLGIPQFHQSYKTVSLTPRLSQFGGNHMPGFIVNLVTETRGINDGEGDSSALVVQFEFC